MPDALSFPSSTPNLGLPLLAAGQSQKEFFLNQALSILDALDQRTVVASLSTPPANAEDGQCFRITSPALGAWQGFEDHIATRIGGAWHFIPPQEGMRLFDIATDHCLFFQAGWQVASPPTAPANGTVVDAEARAAIGQLIQALRDIGIFGPAGS